jgi:hypothetical protein
MKSNEDLPLMAWTRRRFSDGGRAEAKAGENIGPGKPPEDIIEKAGS